MRDYTNIGGLFGSALKFAIFILSYSSFYIFPKYVFYTSDTSLIIIDITIVNIVNINTRSKISVPQFTKTMQMYVLWVLNTGTVKVYIEKKCIHIKEKL